MAQAYRQDRETGEWVQYDPKKDREKRAEEASSSVKPAVRRKELEEYAATVDQLGETARTSLESVLAADLQQFSPDMTDKEWKELREVLIEDLYQTRTYWSDAAGMAATEFYDNIITNRSATGYFNPAYLPDPVSRKVCADVVRALAHLVFEGRIDKFIEKVCDNAQNGVRAYANKTIIANCKRDGMKGVRYARVPVGIETCAFCIMLASRGFVYHSKKSAGENEHMHPNCDCKIVPGFDGDVIEGYDRQVYLNMYNAAASQYEKGERWAGSYWRHAERGKNVNEILKYMRRKMLYPVHKDHINEVKRQWWEKNKDYQNAKRRDKKKGAGV